MSSRPWYAPGLAFILCSCAANSPTPVPYADAQDEIRLKQIEIAGNLPIVPATDFSPRNPPKPMLRYDQAYMRAYENCVIYLQNGRSRPDYMANLKECMEGQGYKVPPMN